MSKIKPPFGNLPIWTPRRRDMVLDLAMLGPGDLLDYSKPNPPMAGTNNGATCVTGPHGPVLNSVVNTNYMELANPIAIPGGTDWTVRFKAKRTVNSNALTYRNIYGNGATDSIWLRQDAYIRVRLNNGNVDFTLAKDFESWATYTFVMLDGVLSLFINGVFSESKTPIDNRLNISHLMASSASDIYGFSGDLEYFVVDSHALSAPEIKEAHDDPWRDWRKDNLLWMAAAQGGVTPPTGIPILRRRRECA